MDIKSIAEQNVAEYTQRIISPPFSNWMMKQTWEDVFFIHWPAPIEVLRKYIPTCLELDTFAGQAWLGMVHFTMRGIFFKGLPVSVVSPFPEINVRTYVTYRGQPGVYFLSLDARHWSTYMIARRWYNLAYYRANVFVRKQDTSFTWESVRKDRRSHSAVYSGTFTPSGDEFYARRGSLEHWLIERYRLFSIDARKHLYGGVIHHPPWRLRKAEATIRQNSLAPITFNECSDTIVHFSPGTEAMFWNIQKLPVTSTILKRDRICQSENHPEV